MAKEVGKDVLYPELSYQIMEIAFEVHNQLGPGFVEEIVALVSQSDRLAPRYPDQLRRQACRSRPHRELEIGRAHV